MDQSKHGKVCRALMLIRGADAIDIPQEREIHLIDMFMDHILVST
jgi:hypothetical protein